MRSSLITGNCSLKLSEKSLIWDIQAIRPTGKFINYTKWWVAGLLVLSATNPASQLTTTWAQPDVICGRESDFDREMRSQSVPICKLLLKPRAQLLKAGLGIGIWDWPFCGELRILSNYKLNEELCHMQSSPCSQHWRSDNYHQCRPISCWRAKNQGIASIYWGKEYIFQWKAIIGRDGTPKMYSRTSFRQVLEPV